MKHLLPLLFGAFLAGCAADTSEPVAVANVNPTYAQHATSHVVTGPTGTAYATWTTADLQKRRLELYRMVPQRPLTRARLPAYTTRGQPLPQQDEIKVIEAELNQRYKAGDKTAELKPAWPDTWRRSG